MAKLLLLLFLILPTHQTFMNNYANEMNLVSSNGVFTINKNSNSDFVRLKRDTAAETSTKSPTSTTPPSNKKGLPSSIDSSAGKIIPKVTFFYLFIYWTDIFFMLYLCDKREKRPRMQVRFFIFFFFF